MTSADPQRPETAELTMPTPATTARPEWTAEAPAGGWASPWPQAAELAHTIPSEQWTLVGGLMVQLHAAKAKVPLNRPTLDVDIVLHIETGAAVFKQIKKQLEELGYELDMPPTDDPIHRFTRGPQESKQIIDVMVADHLSPRYRPTLKGRPVFRIPTGTSALRKTVNCTIEIDGAPTRLSLPTVLGALIPKGEAHLRDSRDKQRHLDDAAILASTIVNPIVERKAPMTRHDPFRLRTLATALKDPHHPSWLMVPEKRRRRAHTALQKIAERPTK
ncbi:hypothetical protein ACFVX3_31425 [Rhodococcus erythropolis]